jgi:nucleoside-diphosphate-sugar epimerase
VPQADGHAFLLGDEDTLSWTDLYTPIADALGFDLGQVPNVEYVKPRRSWNDLIQTVRKSGSARSLRTIVPKGLRRALHAALIQETTPPPPWADRAQSARHSIPQASLEMALLYRCAYKLPHTKAQQILGYEPIVPFVEACRRTIGWLEFSGYAVRPFSCAGQPVL